MSNAMVEHPTLAGLWSPTRTSPQWGTTSCNGSDRSDVAVVGGSPMGKIMDQWIWGIHGMIHGSIFRQTHVFFTRLLPVRISYVKSVGSLRLNAGKLGVAEESPRKKWGNALGSQAPPKKHITSHCKCHLQSVLCHLSPRHQEFANLADKYCILHRRYLQTWSHTSSTAQGGGGSWKKIGNL